jgi:hypothetical protein
MRFSDLGDVTAYLCVPLTLLTSYYFVLPRLYGPVKLYYVYLMSWAVPYTIGNICDSNQIGPVWVQWHLVDISYESWAMVLGVTLYVSVMYLAHRMCTQRPILIAACVSLVLFMGMAYAWEIGQSWLAWRAYKAPFDWSDYASYADGAALALLPFIVSRRLRAALHTNKPS